MKIDIGSIGLIKYCKEVLRYYIDLLQQLRHYVIGLEALRCHTWPLEQN